MITRIRWTVSSSACYKSEVNSWKTTRTDINPTQRRAKSLCKFGGIFSLAFLVLFSLKWADFGARCNQLDYLAPRIQAWVADVEEAFAPCWTWTIPKYNLFLLAVKKDRDILSCLPVFGAWKVHEWELPHNVCQKEGRHGASFGSADSVHRSPWIGHAPPILERYTGELKKNTKGGYLTFQK